MTTFDEALDQRLQTEILERCTLCGKCAAVCPMPGPAGLDAATEEAGAALVEGVLDLLQGGGGTEQAREWATVCTGSGHCIEACPEAVNPRFMLNLARLAMRREGTPEEARANGRRSFGIMASGVKVLERVQLSKETLARIDPASAKLGPSRQNPEVVYYTGCNMLRTPHIGLLCLEILDGMQVPYEVMGGPGHCCGIFQFREGDTETSARIAGSTIDKFAATEAPEVLAWCPSCVVQFGEVAIPTFEAQTKAATPFDMLPFYTWLGRNLDRLTPLMTTPLKRRVALVERPGLPGARDAAIEIAKAIPGVDYVALPDVERVAISSNYLTLLPDFKEKLLQEELDACIAADVDTLATIFHPCHREICHLGEGRPFEIVNLMELVGESMGIHVEDIFKKLKIMSDIDEIMEESADLIAEHKLDAATIREHLEAEIIHANPFAGVFSKE